MENSLQVFESTQFGELAVMTVDGKELFPATECARILKYRNPHQAIRKHCKGVSESLTPTSGGMQPVKYIGEGDLYRLIARSNLEEAVQFERWIFEEVLPAIRKHGVYATPRAVEDMLADPDTMIRALTELKTERRRRQSLELETAQQRQQIAELQPKASYYDLILQSRDLVPITLIAKDYGMSGRAFNALLHELGIQYRMAETWLLYQHHADQGFTQSRTHVVDSDRATMHTYWTQKGRLFLYELLKRECGLLPVMEREKVAS